MSVKLVVILITYRESVLTQEKQIVLQLRKQLVMTVLRQRLLIGGHAGQGPDSLNLQAYLMSGQLLVIHHLLKGLVKEA